MSQPLTIVSGLPRSGTSLMMQILKQAGKLPFENDYRSADVDNPNGYFEYDRVFNLPRGDTGWLENVGNRVVKIIIGYLSFLPSSFEYKIIFMNRDTREVAKSLQIREEHAGGGAMAPGRYPAPLSKYKDLILSVLSERPNFKFVHINFSDCFSRPEIVAHSVNEFLGIPVLTAFEIAGIADSRLYRVRV